MILTAFILSFLYFWKLFYFFQDLFCVGCFVFFYKVRKSKYYYYTYKDYGI